MAYPLAVGGAGRRRHGAGEPGGDGLLDGGGDLRRLRHPLVGEHPGEPRRISLADGPDLPDTLAAVELQGGHGGLGVQTGEGERGDLGAVESGHGDEGGGDRAEPGRLSGSQGQREEHGDAVHRAGQGVQIHGQPVVGRGLPGHLEAGHPVRRGVGYPLGAPDGAPLVPERGPGHDG